ncbi:hypothetical protein [Kytococcus sedentarius]|uniref:hypothetical protein n=1 Tax=Kytococcus sedentarius TaxID=1276 RepID=UPI00384FFC56
MTRRARIPALVAVAALLATGLTACNKQTSSCDFQTGKGGECVIDTTGSAGSVQLGFFVTPGKSGNDFADHYDFLGSENGVARFVATRDGEYECRQGETIPVGTGQAECLIVEDNRLKVRIWVGNPD